MDCSTRPKPASVGHRDLQPHPARHAPTTRATRKQLNHELNRGATAWQKQAAPGRWLRHQQPRTISAGAEPDDLMRQLASEYGVRIVAGGDEEDEDEDEEWDDVVSELGNPYDMRPARVGLMDDMDDDDGGRIPLPPLPASAAAAAAAASSSTTSPFNSPISTNSSTSSSTSTSGGSRPYLDPAALPRMGRAELLALAATGSRTSATADGGGGGGGGGDNGGSSSSTSGRSAVVLLLDVREAAELAAEGALEGGAVSSPSSAFAPALSWAAQQPGVEVRHVALSELRRAAAEELAAAADYVAVVATGDHRGEQAVVRLTKVYGMRRVVLYDGAEDERS